MLTFGRVEDLPQPSDHLELATNIHGLILGWEYYSVPEDWAVWPYETYHYSLSQLKCL